MVFRVGTTGAQPIMPQKPNKWWRDTGVFEMWGTQAKASAYNGHFWSTCATHELAPRNHGIKKLRQSADLFDTRRMQADLTMLI